MPLSTLTMNPIGGESIAVIIIAALSGMKMETKNPGSLLTKGRVVTYSLALALGSFTTFWAHSPESIQIAAVAATLLTIADTLSGVVCACIFREFRSRTLRERLIVKLLYYALFVFSSYIIGGLLKAYWMLGGPWYAICVIELASIAETLTRLHVKGGKKFGPLESLLAMMARAMGQAAQSTLPNEAENDKKDKKK